MSTTPNLSIALLTAGQSNKYVTLNNAFIQFDKSVNSVITEVVSGTTFSLLQADYQGNGAFIITGNPTGPCVITLPAFARRFVIINETSGAGSGVWEITLKVGSGAAEVVITDALPHLIYCDGVNSVYGLS